MVFVVPKTEHQVLQHAYSPGDAFALKERRFPFETRIGDDAYDKYPEVIQQIVEMTALGRLGEANDVGAVIAAVLSDDFRWVTGQHIEASGGARLSVGS